MTTADYIVIAVFTLLIVFIGISFSGTSGKNMKSFFAAGGAMPWWISGLSLFMGFVSAGTFVVWGSIAYSSGFVSVTIQWTMSIAGFLTGFLIAPRWHKTKALTAAEYITGRFGVNVQKTYTYLYLSIMVFMTGVYLYSVSRLLEVSTGLPLNYIIVILGILVILYTSIGGLWAVVVTDTLQFVILTSAAIVVVPLSLEKVGGIQQFINSLPTEGFLSLTNHEYTWSFLLGFGLYNFFYLSGQWGFVQRYTSVASPADAKKVGWIFGALYVISPVIWMLPPMIYRMINGNLNGLENEGAYLNMCKEVLPAGMLGLMMVSLVFATTSSVQGVLNISAGVITNDLYRNKNPHASESRLMKVAKLSTIGFGLITMIIALLVPFLGGAKEVVLSVAALTGCPMYLPLVWSLFSRRQNGRTILATTIVSLIITLSFKFLFPAFTSFNLSRAGEMILGVAVPVIIIFFFEILLRLRNAPEVQNSIMHTDSKTVQTADSDQPSENSQGLRMISIGIIATGVIMALLGFMASSGKIYVLGMASILLIIGGRIMVKSLNKNKKAVC